MRGETETETKRERGLKKCRDFDAPSLSLPLEASCSVKYHSNYTFVKFLLSVSTTSSSLPLDLRSEDTSWSVITTDAFCAYFAGAL